MTIRIVVWICDKVNIRRFWIDLKVHNTWIFFLVTAFVMQQCF